MTHIELKQLAEEAVREYRLCRRDHALTYVRMARRFSKVPGISRVAALEIAASTFPGSHEDFIRRQNAGEKLPVLFPREGASFETRRAQAAARGGIIG